MEKQFTIYLENKKGMLAKVCKLLSAKKINIKAISVSATPDVGLVHITVDNPSSTRSILKSKNIPFTEQDVITISVTDKPGTLAEIASLLAENDININYIYGSTCGCKEPRLCNLVISTSDLKKSKELLKKD